MTDLQDSERRYASDRRRFARGGRRPTDKTGLAPLVLVAGDDARTRTRCEEILCALKFAVVPALSVEETIRILHAIKPNLVVSQLPDNEPIREAIAQDESTATIPIIAIDETMLEPQPLVEEIRRVIRAQNTLAYPRTG